MKEFFNHIAELLNLPLTHPVPVFALILFVILISPILVNKIKIPGIVGLILSGILIGPYGLNIIENNSAVELFATIGLLYILFVAGLDLDMKEFLANKNKSFLFGFLTFTIPLVIGFPAFYFIFSYDFNASLLIGSMLSTHTLVAYPIVSKLGISKNQSVAITVGGTILADTAALIILAIVLGNGRGTLNLKFWATFALSIAVFSGIMFYIIPKIAKWFFHKMESEKHAHYIFSLFVVFFAAFLSQLAGLEPIIGAFVSGLALNRHIPHSSPLMNRIEFIGNSLFIPFFLIYVGMLVNVSVILKGPHTLVLALSLTVLGLFGKFLAAHSTTTLFKFSKSQRNLIFGLSSSKAAAALAVILIGYKAKILDENVLNGTVVLILITCIVASIITEKAAKKLIIFSENSRQLVPKNENYSDEHILIPIANYTNINKLLEFALLIKALKSANPVSILSIVPNNQDAEKNIFKSKEELQQYVKQGAETENRVNIISTIDPNPASGIARISREIMADMLIIGWPHLSIHREKVISETIANIINQLDKTIFVTCFKHPLIVHTQIILITPPLAEKEFGFIQCINKVTRISFELTTPILHVGNIKTHEFVKKHLKKNNFKAVIKYKEFEEWDDFVILSRMINPNDMIILISARKGYISYINQLDSMPNKMEKYFESNSKIVIYPQQVNYENINEGIDEFSTVALAKSI